MDKYTDNIVTVTPPLTVLRAVRDGATASLKRLQQEYDEEKANLTAQIRELEAAFEKQNFELINDLSIAEDIAGRAEEQLRIAVINAYRATGLKTVDKDLKLSVRVNRKVFIADGPAAINWAKLNAPMLISESLNEKGLVKIVETLPDLPEFLTVTETPIAVIGELN